MECKAPSLSECFTDPLAWTGSVCAEINHASCSTFGLGEFVRQMDGVYPIPRLLKYMVKTIEN
jgi:hypothetical protein